MISPAGCPALGLNRPWVAVPDAAPGWTPGLNITFRPASAQEISSQIHFAAMGAFDQKWLFAGQSTILNSHGELAETENT